MQCRAKAKSTGLRCTRHARVGYRTCPMHGIGTKKRVKEGTRKSPAQVHFKHGQYAKPETHKERLDLDAEYRVRFQEIEANPQLMNLTELGKRLYAGLMAMDNQAYEKGEDRQKAIVAFAFAIARYEQVKTGQLARSEKFEKIFVEACRKVFYEFVPREHLEEAVVRLRALVREMGDVDGGGDGRPLSALPDPGGSKEPEVP